MQYKLIGDKHEKINIIVAILFGCTEWKLSKKGTKSKLKGGEKHKIGHIGDNNEVSVLTSTICSASL